MFRLLVATLAWRKPMIAGVSGSWSSLVSTSRTRCPVWKRRALGTANWLDAVADTWATPAAELGRQLVRTLLNSWADDDIGPTLRAVLLSAAHDAKARDKLRLIVERSLIGESALGSDEQDRLRRSGLIASQLIGFAMMRYVWKIEPIASMSDDEALAALAPNLQRYVDGDIDEE